MMEDEAKLMQRLVNVATALTDGHLTIMRFTGNWRVGLGTPSERDGIDAMSVGDTFEAAAQALLEELKKTAYATTGAYGKQKRRLSGQ
jgi:hypothetical protein